MISKRGFLKWAGLAPAAVAAAPALAASTPPGLAAGAARGAILGGVEWVAPTADAAEIPGAATRLVSFRLAPVTFALRDGSFADGAGI